MWSYCKQECIPVGCVPPAAVAVRGLSPQTPPGTMHTTPQDHAPPLGPCTHTHPPGAGTPQWTDTCL